MSTVFEKKRIFYKLNEPFFRVCAQSCEIFGYFLTTSEKSRLYLVIFYKLFDFIPNILPVFEPHEFLDL